MKKVLLLIYLLGMLTAPGLTQEVGVRIGWKRS